MHSSRSVRAARAGFTLIEMMVVVCIIAIMAAAAGPSVIRLMQDRKSQREALSVLSMLQDAHTRSFGRGSAVIATFTVGPPQRINFTESLQDIDGAGTPDIPNPSCSGTQSAVLRYWQTNDADQPTDISMHLNNQYGVNAVTGSQAICFTPRGGTKARVGTPEAWRDLTDVVRFDFLSQRTNNNRVVFLYPNGQARLRI